MRNFPASMIGLAAALLALTPAAAQKIGARTQAPAQVLAQMGEGNSDAELERAIAAAAPFPLGSLQNPVRVGGPEERRLYVARVQCPDGSKPVVGAASNGGVGAFGSIVESMTLDCGGAAGKVQLHVDLYHDGHRETRAPAGLTIGAR